MDTPTPTHALPPHRPIPTDRPGGVGPAALLAEYQLCVSCGVVDRDQGRRRLRYPCPACGVPGAGGLLFFPPGALALAELMESRPDASERPLAIVLLFCSLGEVLLQHLLAGRMDRMGLPEAVRHRLLDDHPTVRTRQDRLFLTLTGDTWKSAARRLEDGLEERAEDRREGRDGGGADLGGALTFWRKAADARDWFLHRGFAWAISAETAHECFESVPGLLALFAALHNEFVYAPPSAPGADEG